MDGVRVLLVSHSSREKIPAFFFFCFFPKQIQIKKL